MITTITNPTNYRVTLDRAKRCADSLGNTSTMFIEHSRKILFSQEYETTEAHNGLVAYIFDDFQKGLAEIKLFLFGKTEEGFLSKFTVAQIKVEEIDFMIEEHDYKRLKQSLVPGVHVFKTSEHFVSIKMRCINEIELY